jgi:hypothetical protein
MAVVDTDRRRTRARLDPLPAFVAGGPQNPMGARGLYLYAGGTDTQYRIHGTNQPEYIGRAIFSGCIRMTSSDSTKEIRPHSTGQRDKVFLVSKVERDEVAGDGMSKAVGTLWNGCSLRIGRCSPNTILWASAHAATPSRRVVSLIVLFSAPRRTYKMC